MLLRVIAFFCVLAVPPIKTAQIFAQATVAPKPEGKALQQGDRNSGDAALDQFDREVASGRYERAHELAKQLIAQDQNSLWAWRAYVRSLHGLNKLKLLSLDANQQATFPRPSGNIVCYALAYSHYLERQYRNTLQQLALCDSTIQAHVLSKNMKSSAIGELGDREAALEILKELYVNKQGNTYVANNLRRQLFGLLEPHAKSLLGKSAASFDSGVKGLSRQIAMLKSEFESAAVEIKVMYPTHSGWSRRFFALLIEVDNFLEVVVIEKEGIKRNSRVVLAGGLIEAELIERYSPAMQILSVEAIAGGSHHTQLAAIAIPKRGEPIVHSHEWQHPGPISFTDLDLDGIPEIIENHSDHYVHSYAAAIVNFNFYLWKYDLQSNSFRRQSFDVPRSAISQRALQYTASGLENVARSQWRPAVLNFEKAVRFAPQSLQAKWNFYLAKYHKDAFEAQFKGNPSSTTALLLGDISEMTAQEGTISEFVSNSLPALQFLRLGLDGFDSQLKMLKRHLYDQNRSANEMFGGAEFSPELRAYEHALISKERGQLFYAEPGLSGRELLAWMTEKAKTPIYLASNSKRPSISRSFSSLTYLYPEASLDSTVLLNRVARLMHLEDYSQALQLMETHDTVHSQSLHLNDQADHLRRSLAIRLGKSHEVLSSVLKSKKINPSDIEVFEQLELRDEAFNRYKLFIDNSCTLPAREREPSQNVLCVEALIGLARVQLAGRVRDSLKTLDDAATMFELQDSKAAAHGSSVYELPALKSIASLKTGQLATARAYNAIAHYALIRATEPGVSWIQSSFYFRYSGMVKLLLTDFEIAKARGDRVSSIAYLAAALSLVRDLSLVQTDVEGRMRISQLERATLQAASEYFCELREPMNALISVNQLRDSSLTQAALNLNQSNRAVPASMAVKQYELTLSQITRDDTALLQFSVGRSGRIYLIVASKYSKSQPIIIPIYLSVAQMRGKVQAVLDSMSGLDSVNRVKESNQLLKALYRELILPAQDFLKACKSLIIIPDDALHYLPFSALMTAEDSYLVERFSISFATSLRALGAGRVLPSSPKAIAVFHSPLTTKSDRLDSSSAELEAIKYAFPRARVEDLQRAQLNRESVLHAMRSQDIIHFGTHTFMDPTAPQKSYFVLNERLGRDGVLSLADLLGKGFRFRGNPIIILAACSSGTGQVFQDGLLGFGAGLTRAGASAIVMAHWAVKDRFSIEFSRIFYESLAEAKEPSVALAAAQRHFLKSTPVADWAVFFSVRSY